MNQITEVAQTVEIKQTIDFQKTTEEFDVVKIRTDNNQFNMTVKNSGDIPVHLTRLWVENTTDSSWPVSKYDLDIAIPSGGSVKNIGQNLGLTALNTQSYQMKVVTERGNTQSMFINSVGSESLYLNLRVTPTIIPTSFSSTVVLEVINTGTENLLNLQPEMDSVVTSCTVSCSATLVSGPTPATFDTLESGNIAIFEWVYTVLGENTGDSVTFTASLVNGVDEDTAVVVVQPIINAENANIALESGGVIDPSEINDSILLFHMETWGVPSPGYEMMSSDVDGGSSGLLFNMETQTAANPVSFMTNNGSQTITIPAGNWNASLALRSEPVATLLKSVTFREDMIFHFEDGVGTSADNSEGDNTRDLEGCGTDRFQEDVDDDVDDAEQSASGSMDVLGSSSDHELVYDDVSSGHQWIGLRWDGVTVPKDATITTADIRFRSDESQTGSSPDLIIGAQDNDNGAVFTTTAHNVDDRWDGTTDTVTTAKVVWNNIPGWSSGEEGADTTTPDLKTIVQELVNRADWNSGDSMVFIIKDNSGGTNTNTRTAEHYDVEGARLTIDYDTGGNPPTWESGQGPHGSGAVRFDGVDQCMRSTNNVSNGDGNDVDNNDNTTSLWFRTDGVGQVSSEQMLVFWEGDGIYPGGADYYKISLGQDGTGKLLFEYNLNQGGTDTTTCRSVNEYDDGNWHQVVATRDQSDDECDLYITDINGVDEETPINGNDDNTSDNVDADGKWYVGTAEENGNFFKGWIDDVMHWNDEELTSAEAEDLSLTNYGVGAHQLDVYLNMTDSDGNFVSTIYNGPATAIAFQDGKCYSCENTDSAYAMVNVTMSLPQTVVLPLQRLNFSMNFVPSTSTWEALELDFKIDDTGFTTPHPSYLQMPMPDNAFTSYLIYDNDDQLEVFVENAGIDGIFFVYQGTRLSLNGDTGSFASFIRYVNGTTASYEVDENRDSIWIPPGNSSQLYFYAGPTDHPCQGTGSSCSAANIIPAGTYKMSIWINGYSDQGETFGRSVNLGNVLVIE